MARPLKQRCISCVPAASYFKPAGIPMRELEEITLYMDELEAMRLTDLEGLYQAEVADTVVTRQPEEALPGSLGDADDRA